jgi:pSer/pThr/pTyr-binding forkhead associated (FHA) protein
VFTAEQRINIGRMPSCEIRFDDTQLSRLHCFIENIGGRWILTDGDGKKQSTNGTWLFVDELFEIYD